MRFLKPLLAGATLATLAVPALALADPYYGERGSDYGYSRSYDHGYRNDSGRDYWRGYDHRDGWRRHHGFRRHARDWRWGPGWDERGWR